MEVITDLFKTIVSGVMGQKPDESWEESRRLKECRQLFQEADCEGGGVDDSKASQTPTSLTLAAYHLAKREIKAEEILPKTKELATWYC